MNRFLKYGLIISLPIILGYVSFYFESTFLRENLSKILLPVLLAILAVTNTSLALVIGKLQELATKLAKDFTETTKEIKKAYMYQIVNIVFAILCLVLLNSPQILGLEYNCKYVLDTLLLLSLSISLSILFDIWHSIFDIIQEIAKLK